MNKNWISLLKKEGVAKEAIIELLGKAYAKSNIFPPKDTVFSAFNFFNPEACKVVIIGQDPYHGAGQANGLSFSVNTGCKIPPSLKNIYKELVSDIGCGMPQSGNLEPWAQQGVLLLNAVLTVEEGQAGSHQKLGWQSVTSAIIKGLSKQQGVVFILLGAWAQKFAEGILLDGNCVIKCVHPSPLSVHRGFFGSEIFSRSNAFLESINKSSIKWEIHQTNQYEFFN